MLSDRQCEQIRDYVKAGGSVMGSFETALYDEDLKPREEFGLADVFGISKAGDVVGTGGSNAYMSGSNGSTRSSTDSPRMLNWIAGAQNRIPLKPVAEPVLSVVPGFCALSSGTCVSAGPAHERSPAVVLRESGREPHSLLSG